ncbi:MAG: HupE/UreJ family protein [Paracoccaceae bacterium]
MRNLSRPALAGLFAALCIASPGFAHTGGAIGGLTSGLLHPITGLDHVVAMVAVGLWGGILGGAAVWQMPVIFPIVMAFAGALGALGVPVPGIETGIALSGVVLGVMVLFMLRPPVVVAAGLVGLFAIFHGHAHGTELPDAANPLTYAVGFVVATGALHLAGIAFGQLIKRPKGQIAVRAAGGVIALAGAAFLTGLA